MTRPTQQPTAAASLGGHLAKNLELLCMMREQLESADTTNADWGDVADAYHTGLDLTRAAHSCGVITEAEAARRGVTL